jgi:hypothetical protein
LAQTQEKDTMTTDKSEFNRNQRLGNFPADKRWKKVEGVLIQPRQTGALPPLVAIAGRTTKVQK